MRGAPILEGVPPAAIHPSILSADFGDLAGELARLAAAGAEMAHVDVMDNHFVPNLTLGLPVVQRLAALDSIPLDCHLMIADPDRWAPGYAEAGAASVTFHVEAASAPVRLARELRANGARAAVAISPATPVSAVQHLLGEVDMVLVMTVEPGFGGQAFLDLTLPKVADLRARAERDGLDLQVQVDGGVSGDTIERAASAGADVFVAGSAVFGADDTGAAVSALRRAGSAAAASRSTPRR